MTDMSVAQPALSPTSRVEVSNRLSQLSDRLLRELGEGRTKLARDREGITTQDERMWATAHVKDFIEEVQRSSYDSGEPTLTEDEREWLAEDTLDRSFSGGRLLRFYRQNPNATNIYVLGGGEVRVEDQSGHVSFHPPVAKNSHDLYMQLRGLIGVGGVRDVQWDTTQPELELILDDGSRLTALNWVGPEVFCTIRRPTLARVTLDDLVANATMSPLMASFLGALPLAGLRYLVGGSMNSGKTVLLRALASALPKQWHVVTVESQAELRLDAYPECYPKFVTSMEARKPNAEGQGEITMQYLVERCQRMSPDLVFLGEIRGAESVGFVKALNQGFPVSSTIHCNSSLDGVYNLAQYYEEYTTASYESALRRAARVIDVVIHMKTLDSGQRVVNSIRIVTELLDNGVVQSEELWAASDGRCAAVSDPTFSSAPNEFIDRLVAKGFDPSASDIPMTGVRGVR